MTKINILISRYSVVQYKRSDTKPTTHLCQEPCLAPKMLVPIFFPSSANWFGIAPRGAITGARGAIIGAKGFAWHKLSSVRKKVVSTKNGVNVFFPSANCLYRYISSTFSTQSLDTNIKKFWYSCQEFVSSLLFWFFLLCTSEAIFTISIHACAFT